MRVLCDVHGDQPACCRACRDEARRRVAVMGAGHIWLEERIQRAEHERDALIETLREAGLR